MSFYVLVTPASPPTEYREPLGIEGPFTSETLARAWKGDLRSLCEAAIVEADSPAAATQAHRLRTRHQR